MKFYYTGAINESANAYCPGLLQNKINTPHRSRYKLTCYEKNRNKKPQKKIDFHRIHGLSLYCLFDSSNSFIEKF